MRITPAQGRAYDRGEDYYMCPRCVALLKERRRKEAYNKSLFGDWHAENQKTAE